MWFIGGGATGSNSGFMEIATGDDGQTSGTYEPIYVSQYGPGDPLTGTLVRRASLLDASGNTIFPNNIQAPIFYDSSNTAFYVDPASTSYMNSVRYVRGAHAYFERSAGVDVGAIGWHTNDSFYVAGHPGYGPGAGNDVRVYGFGNSLHLGNATYGDVLTVAGGYTQGTGSIRAPIFYDSNDTGYYVDPNSTSNLAVVTVQNYFSDVTSRAANEHGYAANFVSTQYSSSNYIPFNFASSYGTHSWGQVGRFRIDQAGADRPSIQFSVAGTDTRWAVGYCTGVDDNFRITQNMGYRNDGGNDGWGTPRFLIDTSGNTYMYSSARSPVFYDNDDTAFYTDPANGGFNLRGGSSNRVTYLTNDSGIIINNAEGSGSNVRVGAAWGLPGIYNGGNIHLMSEGSVVFRTQNSERGYIDSSANLFAYGSMRAPIFYDQNDTSYYADLNNTGISVRAAGSVQGSYFVASNYSATGYTQYKGYDNNNHFIVVRGNVGGNTTSPSISGAHQTTFVEYAENNDSTGWLFRTSGTGNYDVVARISRSYSYFESSVRSPIFYDVNDTNYYSDPASTSQLNYLNTSNNIRGGNGVTAANASISSGFGAFTSTPSNGYLITTNINYNVFNMPTVIVEGYAYGNGVPIHIEIVWYSYNNGFVSYAYTNLGAWDPGAVRIGTNGSDKICIHFSNNIYYGRMNVRAVYDQGPDYLLNWSVQQDVSYSGLGRITEVGPVPTVGAVNTSRNCYMPIVYDYNDTAYNCNPASRSAFNQATFAGGLAYSGAFVLSGSGATLDNSTGARLTESYGAYWNFSNNATWHHQIINGSSLVGISAGGGNFGGGNILASGNITAYYSDERLKTKLTTIKNALDKVRSLEGFIYVENDLAKSLGYTNSNEQAGVSAQRVKAVLPQAVSLAPVDMQGVPETGEIVSKSGENYLTVDYSRIVPLLIEAIKEQDTEITTLRSQLQQQQLELDELKSLVKSLLANR
jgi:hypothetical protein